MLVSFGKILSFFLVKTNANRSRTLCGIFEGSTFTWASLSSTMDNWLKLADALSQQHSNKWCNFHSANAQLPVCLLCTTSSNIYPLHNWRMLYVHEFQNYYRKTWKFHESALISLNDETVFNYGIHRCTPAPMCVGCVRVGHRATVGGCRNSFAHSYPGIHING